MTAAGPPGPTAVGPAQAAGGPQAAAPGAPEAPPARPVTPELAFTGPGTLLVLLELMLALALIGVGLVSAGRRLDRI